jgi:hypothetical protein
MEQELQKELREGLIFSPIPYYEVKEMVATLLAYESKRNGHDAGTYVKSILKTLRKCANVWWKKGRMDCVFILDVILLMLVNLWSQSRSQIPIL